MVSLTEYILAYAKNDKIQLFGGLPQKSESQPIIKRTNAKKTLLFPPLTVKTKLKDGIYEKGVYGRGSSASELLEDIEIKNGLIVTPLKIHAPFVWSQDFLNAEIKKGTEIIVNTNNFQVRVIRHNNDSIKALPSFIDGREENATNEDAYELLKDIFHQDSPFQYSKPKNLIRKLILSNSYKNKEVTILDFFAGSGTTLHATMQLNAEDGGHRQCILVTNNENGICENVTYERNKRVIQGYTTPKGEEVPGLTANTLRYYKTDFISRDRTQRNMHALVEAATDLLCIKEDLYEEQTHFGRYKTHPKALRYFAQGSKRMLVLYRDEYTEEVAAEIENIELPQDEKIKIYIFSPDRYAYDDMFEDVADKVTLVALPAAIYDAYKKVLPKRKEKLLELATEDNEANEKGGEK
ncbi:MAG: DNA methyltransferase [Alloprevotella sp.]